MLLLIHKSLRVRVWAMCIVHKNFILRKKSYLTEFFFLKKARIHPYVKVTNRNKSTIPETTMLKKPETVLVKNTLKKNWKSIYPPTSSSNSSIKNEKNNPVYVENHFIFLLLFSDDQPFRIDANFSVKNSNLVDFFFIRHFLCKMGNRHLSPFDFIVIFIKMEKRRF